MQAAGNVFNQRGHAGPAVRLPDAVFLLAHGGRLGALGSVFQQQTGEGGLHSVPCLQGKRQAGDFHGWTESWGYDSHTVWRDRGAAQYERLGQFIAARQIYRMTNPGVRVARSLAALRSKVFAQSK